MISFTHCTVYLCISILCDLQCLFMLCESVAWLNNSHWFVTTSSRVCRGHVKTSYEMYLVGLTRLKLLTSGYPSLPSVLLGEEEQQFMRQHCPRRRGWFYHKLGNLLQLFYFKDYSFQGQRAYKTVPIDQQGHFGWIKKKIQQICTNNGQ